MWLELFDRWISPSRKDNTRCYSVCCCTNRLDYFRNIFETAKNKKWVGHPTFYIPLKTISITRSASAYQCLHEDCCSWSLNSPKLHPLHTVMATSFWYIPVKKKSEFLNFSWMKKIPVKKSLAFYLLSNSCNPWMPLHFGTFQQYTVNIEICLYDQKRKNHWANSDLPHKTCTSHFVH